MLKKTYQEHNSGLGSRNGGLSGGEMAGRERDSAENGEKREREENAK